MSSRYILPVVLVGILILWRLSADRPIRSRTTERTISLHPDSTVVEIDRTPVRVNLRARLRPRKRSLVLDSVIERDTLHVEIAADSTIQIQLLPAPRSSREWVRYLRRDSVITIRACEFIDRPWYESPLLVIAGAVLGALIAILI